MPSSAIISHITAELFFLDNLDISTDGIDNDGDGLIDSEDTDEIGAPRNSARLIAVNKIAEKILTKITSTW